MIIHNALGRDFESMEFGLGDQILNKGENFKISCFSRLIEWKGIETLIIAFKLYRDLGGSGTLSIFGNGPIKDYLLNRAKELEIFEYITFHGYVSDVIEEMKKSSVIVAPSDSDEPLGRVAMESMRLGVPVIASDKGGFLEIIDHRVNGLLFKQKSYDALSKTLYDIYNNLSLRSSLAEEGLKQSKEWSSKNYSQNLLKFIEENK
jgi:glycosyltransferase involved in cell wall biosynthesis